MKIRIGVALSALFFLAIKIDAADAACICKCVDGEMQPLCQSSIDLPPICPPAVPPSLPPLGTSQCRQARVCDNFGNCQWQQVCR